MNGMKQFRRDYEKPFSEAIDLRMEECFVDTDWKPIVDDDELG